MSKILLALALAASALAAPGRTLYVSPQGADRQAGTVAAPLRTLAGARDRVRALGPDRGAVTILFAGGTYTFAEPVDFDRRDAGTAAAPILYRALPGAEVRWTGGRCVEGWGPVTDSGVRERLVPEARDHVRVTDLRAQGITDFGTLAPRGFGQPSRPAEAELFCAGRPQHLARWPNTGFRKVTRTLDLQHVVVDTDRLARWTAETDPWVFAYWHHDWAELYEPLAGLDPAGQVLVRRSDIRPQYGLTPDRARWYALNLLSEIDQPGEYYLDRQAGRLYAWPPDTGGETVLSQADGVLRLDGVSHVTFRGFLIEACRGTAVSLKGGAHCAIVGCTLRDLGQRAVVVEGGTDHTVYGCEVYDCGEGGILMRGGDRPSLTPAHHNAENNHVYRYSRRARTYKAAIAVSGVGNRIAHNLVHDGPHMALAASGNEHTVEYNEIHNVVYESGDAGAFYVGRDWTQRGNTIRYNYWHHIVGGAGYGGMTIYLDDQHCGYTIHGNLFERCSRAVFIGGGDDNVVTNNVFLNCWRAAHLDNRGMGWQKAATDDPNGTLRTRLRAMPYQSDLWRRRYPTLVDILADQPNIPKRNVFRANISAGGTWDDIVDAIRPYQTVARNLVFDNDPNWIRVTRDAQGRPQALRFQDPAAVAATGFQALPLDRMGLYPDPRRALWPVPHVVRPVTLPGIPQP